MHPTSQRIQQLLVEKNCASLIQEFPEGTHTAADAARALSTTIAQIAKSIVLMAENEPILVIVSGAHRISLEKVSTLLDKTVRQATPDEVKEHTGFSIGGVAPLGHNKHLIILIDEDLLQFDRVWAAAGTPRAVFAITPHELVRITGGRIVQVA